MLEPLGPFSLREAALFGFGHRHEQAFAGCMRLSFCLDGYADAAGVVVTQDDAGRVHGEVITAGGAATTAAVAAQVARVLSLDVDARGFATLAQADPVLAPLYVSAPGLRPPLFYSPYEAALWSVLSARRPWRTGQAWRAQLARAAGASFELAGQTQWSVPLPQRVCELGVAGVQAACAIEAERARRIVAVAAAATRGELDAAELTALAQRDLDRARARLQTLPGIGPFYANLILIRASGLTDVLPDDEPRFLATLAALRGLDRASGEHARHLARSWSPWRTWAAVLVRAAGGRLLARSSARQSARGRDVRAGKPPRSSALDAKA